VPGREGEEGENERRNKRDMSQPAVSRKQGMNRHGLTDTKMRHVSTNVLEVYNLLSI
jgi:hypothetical protein